MAKTPVKPFLIGKNDRGELVLTYRETRYNSQGYPWVTQTRIEQTFRTAAEARAYAGEQFGATYGEFAIK